VRPGPRVLALGIAQDGGMPQAGCACGHCSAAWEGRIPKARVSAVAVVDPTRRAAWMIDATPDFPAQLRHLREMEPEAELRGLFLTHAHVGHYTGLVHLGREAMNARGLPVGATASCLDFLRRHGPWSQLVALGNVVLQPLAAGAALRLTDDLEIEPVAVPHRAEFSDTLAFGIRGPSRSLFYCPDIDRWEDWRAGAREFLGRFDTAWIDGTFYSPEEWPQRDRNEIPHPPVTRSVELFRGLQTAIRFLHLNHSNPLHLDSPERTGLRALGFDVVREGETVEL